MHASLYLLYVLYVLYVHDLLYLLHVLCCTRTWRGGSPCSTGCSPPWSDCTGRSTSRTSARACELHVYHLAADAELDLEDAPPCLPCLHVTCSLDNAQWCGTAQAGRFLGSNTSNSRGSAPTLKSTMFSYDVKQRATCFLPGGAEPCLPRQSWCVSVHSPAASGRRRARRILGDGAGTGVYRNPYATWDVV